jgi:subtilisin-like proprotein convertase family protein
MKSFRLALLALTIVALAVGSAFATKQDEINSLTLKPWSITDLPQLSAMADVNEAEPNDACPGNAYTAGDNFHGEINPAGDLDFITFTATAGDEITIGTDADGALPTVDTVIELYADDCSTLLTSDDDGGPGLYSLISGFAAPYTGSYNLKIRGFSATTSTGNYLALGNVATPQGPGFCPLGTYKAIKRNVNLDIPDNDPAGLDCPDITFWDLADGSVITDVVVDLNIEHTWVGDLVITLCHTSDSGAVTCVNLVDRPGVPESSFGCSGDLVSDPENKYYFSSRQDLALLGETDCPTVIDPACYHTAIESVPGLEVFNGLPFGDGSWSLEIVDNGAGDTGFVYNWSVHLLADAPVSVEASSWGSIKANYR